MAWLKMTAIWRNVAAVIGGGGAKAQRKAAIENIEESSAGAGGSYRKLKAENMAKKNRKLTCGENGLEYRNIERKWRIIGGYRLEESENIGLESMAL